VQVQEKEGDEEKAGERNSQLLAISGENRFSAQQDGHLYLSDFVADTGARSFFLPLLFRLPNYNARHLRGYEIGYVR